MRACVQMGHVGSSRWGPGAAYEEEHIQMVAPYVVSRLQQGGAQVSLYGGDMPFGMTHDLFMALHCDSDGGAFGWSLGFRDDTHPGSSIYAHVVRDYYARLGGGWYRENITPGEHRYNGFSHFGVNTKCALIEIQFVSNARGRAWIEEQPDKIGYAIADGMLAYAGVHMPEVREVSVSSTRTNYGRVAPNTVIEDHAHIGQNGLAVEDCWVIVTACDKPAVVNMMVFNNDGARQTKPNTANPPYTIQPWKTVVLNVAGFGIPGTVAWRIWSDEVILLSSDSRVTT